jgi:hypothetical protein
MNSIPQLAAQTAHAFFKKATPAPLFVFPWLILPLFPPLFLISNHDRVRHRHE